MCITVYGIGCCAAVIGKGGESIQRMQNESGAKIQVAPGVWDGMTSSQLLFTVAAMHSALSGDLAFCRWE